MGVGSLLLTALVRRFGLQRRRTIVSTSSRVDGRPIRSSTFPLRRRLVHTAKYLVVGIFEVRATNASNPIGSITLDTMASIDLLVSALSVLLNENAKVSVLLCYRSPSVE